MIIVSVCLCKSATGGSRHSLEICQISWNWKCFTALGLSTNYTDCAQYMNLMKCIFQGSPGFVNRKRPLKYIFLLNAHLDFPLIVSELKIEK